MRGTLTILSLVSVVFFPWPLTALLAAGASSVEPLVPLAVGLFADTLYYAPQAGALPLFTLCGILLTAISFFVRSRLKTGSIGR
ncbi:hypothetical protein D4R49_00140 [bacterium]|nr:MAG: hypothetical protein D4R49_00140 [bacterium]